MPGVRSRFTARYGVAAAGACVMLAITGAGLSASPAPRVQAEPSLPFAPAPVAWTTAVDDAATPDPAPLAATVGSVRGLTLGAEIEAALDAARATEAKRQRAERKAKAERAARLAERQRRAADRAYRAALYVAPVGYYRLSAGFGDRGGWSSGRHTGLDFRAPVGTPVMAVHDARVAKTAYHPAYGRMIILDLGGGVTAWYCHLSQVSVFAGERVSTGERIGAVGVSGNTSGPHLHFEVRLWDQPTDPSTFLWGSHRGTPSAAPSWTYGTVQPYDTLGQYNF